MKYVYIRYGIVSLRRGVCIVCECVGRYVFMCVRVFMYVCKCTCVRGVFRKLRFILENLVFVVMFEVLV